MTLGSSLQQIAPSSLRQRVLHILREAIISGQFQPGDRLIEEELCQQMGISRGPLREALRQLEQEGLVVSFPYRATEVIGVSDEEVRDVLIPIRFTLECFAFRHALPLLTDNDFAELEELIKIMRQSGESGDLARVVEADVKFHELVLGRAQQQHCLQIWRTISPRVRAYFYRHGPQHQALTDIADEHQDLLEVMRTRDIERVLSVLEPHILVDAIVGGNLPPNQS
jgi:DNA-binding GntR family transcriptional regulator